MLCRLVKALSRSILTFFAATLRDFEGGPATVESVSRAWEAVLVRHGAFNQSLVRDALTLQAKDDMESVRRLVSLLFLYVAD